jgi:hypothetical protein
MEWAWFRKERTDTAEPLFEGDSDLEAVPLKTRPRNLGANTAFIDSFDSVPPLVSDEFAKKVAESIHKRAQERLEQAQ